MGHNDSVLDLLGKAADTFIGIDFGDEVARRCPACGYNQFWCAVQWDEENKISNYWVEIQCIACASRLKAPGEGDPHIHYYDEDNNDEESHREG